MILNPLLNKSRMYQTYSIYLPGSRFVRRADCPAISAQVPRFTRGELVHGCDQQILSGVHVRFQASEEMGKRGVLVAQRLREPRGRRLGEPGELRNCLELSKAAGNIDAGDGLFASPVGFGAGIERPIPEPARGTEPLVRHTYLRRIRVAANPKGSLRRSHAHIIGGPQRMTTAGASPLGGATGAAGRLRP